MNKFYMNGKLIHKASDHNTKRCEVEKWVFLPHSDFERLKANPYQEHEAITAARDLMYEDKNAYHCIMLLDGTVKTDCSLRLKDLIILAFPCSYLMLNQSTKGTRHPNPS